MFSLMVVKLRMSLKRMVTSSFSPPSDIFSLSRCAMTLRAMYLPIVVFISSAALSWSTIELKPVARSSSSSPVLTMSTWTKS
jgi:hypothetical protein